MAAFDINLWKSRAWDRFTRRVRKGDDKTMSELQWALDLVAAEDILKVITWCESKGITVTFEKKVGGFLDWAAKHVMISSRLSPQKQLAFLLHECGHFLVGPKVKGERYIMGYIQTDPDITKTFHHRVDVLEEEMEAWHRGWSLSRRLKLAFTRESFDEARLECLKTYIKWAVKPNNKEST